ncbi:ECF RNA polymerase sigma factor SigE [Microbacterium oxydans]|uniref:ECF RNA polymerase sigma factor SigE n=1 Tax=Microbacterium oxydans TaxID=82380 RepID=A0A3Q9J210_9MICO|nr:MULTISPECIES: RNA polymerase sigma factor [Microbacterium]AZS39407.1 ECF RNA polymerase sigma factor SigE [Microbacterium oxydans]
MRDDSDDTARTVLSAMIEGDPDRLRRRSISLGVPVDDADDAAQNALLRAWSSISHLDTPQPGRMCAWLDVIARNVAVDLARQRSRRPAATLEEAADEHVSVESVVEARVLLDGAMAAVHALPPTLREPLLLTVADGLSAEEVATRLGIEPAAARQRISRARKALKACRGTGMGVA